MSSRRYTDKFKIESFKLDTQQINNRHVKDIISLRGGGVAYPTTSRKYPLAP